METNKTNPITGTEGSPIELGQAASWTKNYRKENPKEPISQFFGKEILERILAQPGCLGIRFYYAIGSDGKKHLIMAGVESNGSDQLTEHPLKTPVAADNVTGVTSSIIFEVGEMSSPCPGSPGCPNNVLTGSND